MSLLDVELESIVYSLDADTKLMCRKEVTENGTTLQTGSRE
jgi:hypothetical protein